MTQRIDTADFNSPQDLLSLMGVYETQDGQLIRMKFDGPLAPEQVRFQLKHPIEFGERDRWTDIDGNVVHGFQRTLTNKFTRYLLRNSVELRGVASVYAYADSHSDLSSRTPTMCVDPDNKSSWVWSVIDVNHDTGEAVVWQADWDHCLNEFVNATRADLLQLQREQLAEETDRRLRRSMNDTVTKHRDVKLAELDAEWLRTRKRLLAQWAAAQDELIRADEAAWNEENDAYRMYGLVLGADNTKTPLRKGLLRDVRKVMRRHEQEHGCISATIYWTVKVDDHIEGTWVKFATYDAERGVWSLHL